MHVRLSTCTGMPVVEEGTEEYLGSLAGALIHPDTGAIEGFFVRVPKFFRSEQFFLSPADIVRFGTRICVRSSDALGPMEDRIRLQALLSDRRTILGQCIRTESGAELGRCSDVQFDTEAMRIEWIFPRRFFRYGASLPVTEIVIVREDAIIVRDPAASSKEPAPIEAAATPSLQSLEISEAGPQPG